MKFVVSLICLAFLGCLSEASNLGSKIFNYDGFLPIKDDRTGQVINETLTVDQSTATNSTSGLEEAEEACWDLISEQSVVTFALQRKVLDELASDIKNLTKIDNKLLAYIEKTTQKLRKDMEEAEKGLKNDAADEFFDALFDTSEDIVALSVILREPNLDDLTFMVFVKAVSRLGRNNAALIQEFTELCSFSQRRRIVEPRTTISLF